MDNSFFDGKFQIFKGRTFQKRFLQLIAVYDNLTIKKKKIELDIQIDPKDIDELEKVKNEFEKYLLLLNKKETMVYWEIPIKNENIIIKYEKNSQLFRDNANKIYFKVNEINDEFKNKFSISNNKFLNFFKKKKRRKEY